MKQCEACKLYRSRLHACKLCDKKLCGCCSFKSSKNGGRVCCYPGSDCSDKRLEKAVR